MHLDAPVTTMTGFLDIIMDERFTLNLIVFKY